MARDKVTLRLTGNWKRMGAAVDAKRFQNNLEANISKATAFNGMMMQSEIRRRIKAKRYEKNSPMTIALKKASTPLIDDGDLWGSVTTKNLSAYTVFVGVLASKMSSDGKPMVNLANFLHSGGAIPITEHMRNLWIVLSEVGQGKRPKSYLTGRAAEIAKALGRRIKNIKPFKPSTTHVVIPPRPFLASVLEDPKMLKKCEANWKKAIAAAMKDQASGESAKGGSPAKVTDPVAASGGKNPGGGTGKKGPANRSEAARRGWQTRRKKQAAKKPSP